MPSPVQQPETAPDLIVGIDLGTTNSLVAWCDPARGAWPEILPDGAGRRLVPSVVRYSPGGHVEAVGHDARRHAAANPGRTVASVKRLMGRSIEDARPDLPYLSYEVVEGPSRTARIRVPGGPRTPEKIVSPQEVSAVILRALKEQASRAMGREVRRAVVTVPAYFDDAQRQATRDAGRLAGLDVIRIVNEPTAAALAYGLGLKNKTAQTIAVYDLGGGTFDVSILSVVPSNSEGADLGADFFQVLSTAGDTHLGGDDVDQMLVQHALDHAAAERGGGAGAVATPEELAQLREASEAAKIALSSVDRAEIAATVAGAPVSVTVTRAELEALIGPWAERTLAACARALRDAGLSPKDIDRVVMVGGATRTPLIRRRVAEFFGAEPYTALDPDEVVALGAAVQASIMAGVNTGSLLLDVIPLSLGIETVGGAVAKLIVRNSTVPARATEMFSTSVDGQTSIKVHVLQGEREMAADCRSLGVFHLRGIPPMPAGIPQLEVEFLVDASGVLSVSALERRSGAAATLQIVPNHGLTREEVERIEAESLAHAREDMTRHRVVDLVVNSKLDLKWIGDRLIKVGPGLDPAVKQEVESLAAALSKLVAAGEADWRGVNPDEMHKAKEALDRASIRLHELSIAKTLRGE